MNKIKTSLLIAVMTFGLVATAQTTAPTPSKKIMKALGAAGKELTLKSNGIWTLPDGSAIYASHPWCAGIKGFAGPTPLYIAVSKAGKITAVAPDKNNETQSIWARVVGARLFKAWNGKTLTDAKTAKVDAVSGATYSSTAVIKTVQTTARKVSK